MNYIKVVLSNRFFTVLVATLALQSSVVLSASLFKLSLPRFEVSVPFARNDERSFQEELVDFDQEALSSMPFVSPELAGELPVVHVISHVVSTGDTLGRIWERRTGSNRGGMYAAEAFRKASVPLSSLRKGETIELQISPEGDITGLKKALDKGRVLLLEGDSQQGYSATIVEPSIAEAKKTVAGTIYSSLSADAAGQGVPYEVIDSFVDLLSGKIDFRRDLQSGDTFAITYEEVRTNDGKVVEYGRIKRASIQSGGQLHAAIGYKGRDGKLRYYDKDGKPIGNYFLRYPVKFTRISSVYTDSRVHPVLGVKRPHHGVDFAAPTGTPVRAVGSGIVSFAGYDGGAGNIVKIRHNGKYSTAYMHLSKFARGMKKGVAVERGQVIGYVGSTGLSTGPHLDFRLAVNNVYINPLSANLPQIPDNYEPIPRRFLVTAVNKLKQTHELQRMVASRGAEGKEVL